MSFRKKNTMNRREITKFLSATVGGGYVNPIFSTKALADEETKPKFLIVLTASGGASIIDSFMAIRESECANAAGINCFPDSQVISAPGTELRGVDQSFSSVGPIPMPFTSSQSQFVAKHKQDIMVATCEVTSVNHKAAQERSLTGNDAWNTRTIQECAAAQFGRNMLLPNVNMSSSGFLHQGKDDTLPAFARHELVTDPGYWALGLHGSKGIKNVPAKNLIDKARAHRQILDANSNFLKTFKDSNRLQRWLAARTTQQDQIEQANLIAKLSTRVDNPATWPLREFGITPDPIIAEIAGKFPNLQSDILDSQAMLASLLIIQGISTTVTLGPSFQASAEDQALESGLVLNNLPIGFDFSHSSHREAQAFMWQRVLDTADRLIDILSNVQFDSSTGESFWDRTLIYIATDFGRDKSRPSGATSFSTGHHLNNAIVAISPMVNGGTILGGVDPNTGLTYGFDPQSGAPEPGRKMTEKEMFSGLLQAMEIDTSGSGLPDMPAMRKKVLT